MRRTKIQLVEPNWRLATAASASAVSETRDLLCPIQQFHRWPAAAYRPWASLSGSATDKPAL